MTDPVVIPSTPSALRMASAYFSTKVTDLPGGKRLEVTLLPTHPEGRIWANLETRVDGKLLVVPIVGEMFRHIKIVPTYFNFSRVSKDDPESFVEETTLSSTDTRAFKLVSITPSFTQRPSETCSVEIEDTSVKGGAAGLNHVLKARISAGNLPVPGSFSGKVVIKTDHPDKPEITLNLFGFFAEPKK